MEAMEEMGFSCAGQPLPKGGGTWKGHVIPGIVFLSWGLYWAANTFKRQLHSQSSSSVFAPKAWYPCLLVGRWLYAFEPFLKIIGGPIGVSIELYWDSHTGFRPLYCSDSGRFAPEYAHNYQHASSYPAFLVSGLIDILGLYVTLPPGTEQVFLAFAFGIEGFLMVLHKKHLPLDMILHELLGYTMLACALGVILELRCRGNFLISVFRSYAVVMQGVWLIAMGQMLFTGSKAWTDEYGGPAMLAPPFYAMLSLLSALGMLVFYLIFQSWHQRSQQYSSLPVTSKDTAPAVALRDSTELADFSIDDSANETSDDGSGSDNSEHTHVGKQRSGRIPIASAAINMLKSARQKTPGKSSEHLT